MATFSVIVPVYNATRYLRQALDSLLHQTYPNFEAIMVDDGSTDGSNLICDEYAQKDLRFKVIHQENTGVTIARKTGIKNASNEYVMWMDSDDYIGLDVLWKINEVIEKYMPDMVAYDYQRVRDDGSVLYVMSNQIEKNKLLRASEHEFYKTMLYDRRKLHTDMKPVNPLDYSLCTKAIRREKITECLLALPDEVCIGEDMGVLFATLCKCESLYALDMAEYYYRMNETSLTNTFRKDDLWRKRFLFKYLYQYANKIPQANIDTYAFGHIMQQFIRAAGYFNNYGDYIKYVKNELTSDVRTIVDRMQYPVCTKHQYIQYWLMKHYNFRGFWLIFHTRKMLKATLRGICSK